MRRSLQEHYYHRALDLVDLPSFGNALPLPPSRRISPPYTECRVSWSPRVLRTSLGFELSAPFVFSDATGSRRTLAGFLQNARNASPPRRGSLGLDSGPLGWPLFRRRTAWSAPRRKRGTRKSGLETNTENEALSALLVRLWCHLPLQNPANRAENLTRLCSATIGQTWWRMVQFGAIRSR